MTITEDDVCRLAELSKLSLAPAEIAPLIKDLNHILDYVSMLDELDVSGVTPTYQNFAQQNVWRKDQLAPFESDRERLLSLSFESQDHQIKVPKVL